MNKLFQRRLASHLKEMFKYLRLVFNDHFVFALLIMIGGLGLAYSNGLKQLTTGLWWPRLIVIVVMLVVLQLGRLATLLKDADVVFLLPREQDMRQYLTAARGYSEGLALVYQLLGLFVLLPFVQATMPLSVGMLSALAVTQLILKDSLFTRSIGMRYQAAPGWLTQPIVVKWLVPAIVLAVSIYVSPLLGLLLSVVLDVMLWVLNRRWLAQAFNWWRAIALENSRMMGIYRFFNLFTNVPMLKGVAKRRRYLDGLLALVKRTPDNAYLYLYSRGIVRSGEFSGLYARLTVLGMVLLYFVRGTWLPILLAALFLYLIGFQLIPFYWQFDDIVFTHLYPIPDQVRTSSFKRLLRTLLFVTAALFWVMVIIANRQLEVIGITAVVEVVEVLLMVQSYLPLRLRKKQ